jgi:hypothetical protein
VVDIAADTAVDASNDAALDSGPPTAESSTPESSTPAPRTREATSGAWTISLLRRFAERVIVLATACRAGISYSWGSYGSCIGEVRPSAESCNGIDDDCNGAIDDGLGNISCGPGACLNTVAACASGLPNTCTPLPGSAGETCGDNIDNNCNGIVDEGCGCTYVSPLGNDTTGTGAASLPFLTIAKAITAAGSNGLPLQVCVGGTATCAGTPATTTYSESVQMRDGVSVLGGYSPVARPGHVPTGARPPFRQLTSTACNSAIT